MMKTTGPDGLLIRNFSIKRISSFRIGGIARSYYIPGDISGLLRFLKQARETNSDYYIVGNASNILFNDRMYKGTLISLKGFTNYIQLEKDGVTAGASLALDTAVDLCIGNSFKGLEKLSGIPGSIGGALVMNAGAFGSEIGDCVEWVKVLTHLGRFRTLLKKEINFTYRKAEPLEKYIILEAKLRLKKGQKKDLLKIRRDILKKRQKNQPLEYPSCGSIFKRPENNFAGTLIEKAGLKGFRIGGAEVSRKHANFIINRGKASARDVSQLMDVIRGEVHKMSGIILEPEIKFFNF
ncbi:MAG: UDP-N-acetylmuramate dehydrogenase [bacterium]|nr:UDP-N-acetylmuramate dehydrogenase [bacterium]